MIDLSDSLPVRCHISWQYMAGLMDGEGSIGTTRTGASRNIVGRVVIANTDMRLLKIIQNQFGGTISARKSGAKETWRPFSSIAWSNQGALRILEMVYPYLLVKREQAALCIQLIRMREAPREERRIKTSMTNHPDRFAWGRLKPEIQAAELAIAKQLNELNRKGVILSS